MSKEQVNCVICGDLFTPDGRQKKRCSKEHIRQCGVCNADFVLLNTDKETKEYCSKLCSNRRNSRMNSCVVCGKEFSKRSKTCSKECSVILRHQTNEKKLRVCAWENCSNEFTGKSTAIYCKEDHSAFCEICGKEFTFPGIMSRRTCSNKCNGALVNSPESMEKRRANSMEKYGVAHPFMAEEIKDKIKASNLERYGVEFALASKEIREKGKKTSIEKYGHEWYASSPQGKIAREATNLERYGAVNPFASESIKEKIKAVNLERYGTEFPTQNKEVIARIKATNLERYGVENVLQEEKTKEKAMQTFYKNLNNGAIYHQRVSKVNKEFAELLLAVFPDSEVKFEKPIGNFFIDIEFKTQIKSILIDINPTVSHNSFKSFTCYIKGCKDFCQEHKPKGSRYHYDRALAAREQDVTLIQKYSWDNDEAFVTYLDSKVSPATKVSARKLKLKKIKQKEANAFLRENHLQGAAAKQSHCYALYSDNGEILAVATFGESRFKSKAEWEFIRYAVKREYIIHGGPGMLLKAFIKEENPSSIISYVDFNHTTRKSTFLNSIGFEEKSPTGPNMIWHRASDNKSIRENTLHRRGPDVLLGTNYGLTKDSGLTNRDVMLREGFLPVYTAGNRVFEWVA